MMVTQKTVDILARRKAELLARTEAEKAVMSEADRRVAANPLAGEANPVKGRPGLGRWLKSQLPGGERAMGLRDLGTAITSPVMSVLEDSVLKREGEELLTRRSRDILADRRWQISKLTEGERARLSPSDVRISRGGKPYMPLVKRAGELGRAVSSSVGDVAAVAANPLKAVEELVKTSPAEVPESKGGFAPDAWYPDSGMGWASEPGGKYLSARYPREFGSWGQAEPGEGWKHISDRGGWDAHVHPSHTAGKKVYGRQTAYKPRRGVGAYRGY